MPMLDRLAVWMAGGVSPDTRFRGAPKTPPEKRRLPDGTYEARLNGVPFRVYDLRPAFERIWAIEDGRIPAPPSPNDR